MEKVKSKYWKKAHKKKLFTYLPVEDVKRLEDIKTKYGFKSVYEILQYLAHCFLRVADPENDPIIESVPDEIKEMFVGLSEAEHDKIHKRFKPINPKTPDDLKY